MRAVTTACRRQLVRCHQRTAYVSSACIHEIVVLISYQLRVSESVVEEVPWTV